MLPQDPYVAPLGDRLCGWIWNGVRIRVATARSGLSQQVAKRIIVVADPIERAVALGFELGQHGGQELVVVPADLGEAVVSEKVSFSLDVGGELHAPQNGHVPDAIYHLDPGGGLLTRSLHLEERVPPSMASDYAAGCLVDRRHGHEAEPADRCLDLLQLVPARVAGSRCQLAQCHVLDAHHFTAPAPV